MVIYLFLWASVHTINLTITVTVLELTKKYSANYKIWFCRLLQVIWKLKRIKRFFCGSMLPSLLLITRKARLLKNNYFSYINRGIKIKHKRSLEIFAKIENLRAMNYGRGRAVPNPPESLNNFSWITRWGKQKGILFALLN